MSRSAVIRAGDRTSLWGKHGERSHSLGACVERYDGICPGRRCAGRSNGPVVEAGPSATDRTMRFPNDRQPGPQVGNDDLAAIRGAAENGSGGNLLVPGRPGSSAGKTGAVHQAIAAKTQGPAG